MVRFPDDFKIVCLHLPHRTDRLQNIERLKLQLGCVEVVEGFTPDTCPISPFIPGHHPIRHAVAQSKVKALSVALHSDKEYILFLEDDCLLIDEGCKRIQYTMDVTPDFDMIYAGWYQQPKDETIISSTHCLLMRREVAEAFIEGADNRDLICRALEFESETATGGSSDIMWSMMASDNNYKVVLIDPPVAWQRGGPSDNYKGANRPYIQVYTG